MKQRSLKHEDDFRMKAEHEIRATTSDIDWRLPWFEDLPLERTQKAGLPSAGFTRDGDVRVCIELQLPDVPEMRTFKYASAMTRERIVNQRIDARTLGRLTRLVRSTRCMPTRNDVHK